MSNKTNNHKTMTNLNEEIQLYKMILSDYKKNDDNDTFIKQMDQFREFLKKCM